MAFPECHTACASVSVERAARRPHELILGGPYSTAKEAMLGAHTQRLEAARMLESGGDFRTHVNACEIMSADPMHLHAITSYD